jgi:hypothetical protein
MENLAYMRLDSKLQKCGFYFTKNGTDYLIFPLPFETKRPTTESIATIHSSDELIKYVDDCWKDWKKKQKASKREKWKARVDFVLRFFSKS